MKFPTTEIFWHLHELEQYFLQLGRGVAKEIRYIQVRDYKCREIGRASGFNVCARTLGDRINRLDRSIK